MINHVVFYGAGDVLPYFAARHEKGEQLKLKKLEVNAGSWHGGIDIVFNVQRTAKDLPWTIDAGGKGMINCAKRTISVWSMGSAPNLP